MPRTRAAAAQQKLLLALLDDDTLRQCATTLPQQLKCAMVCRRLQHLWPEVGRARRMIVRTTMSISITTAGSEVERPLSISILLPFALKLLCVCPRNNNIEVRLLLSSAQRVSRLLDGSCNLILANCDVMLADNRTGARTCYGIGELHLARNRGSSLTEAAIVLNDVPPSVGPTALPPELRSVRFALPGPCYNAVVDTVIKPASPAFVQVSVRSDGTNPSKVHERCLRRAPLSVNQARAAISKMRIVPHAQV